MSRVDRRTRKPPGSFSGIFAENRTSRSDPIAAITREMGAAESSYTFCSSQWEARSPIGQLGNGHYAENR